RRHRLRRRGDPAGPPQGGAARPGGGVPGQGRHRAGRLGRALRQRARLRPVPRLLRRRPAALRPGPGAGAAAGRAGVPDVFQRRGAGDRGAAAGVAAGALRRLRRRLAGRIRRAGAVRDPPGGQGGPVLGGRAEDVVRRRPAAATPDERRGTMKVRGSWGRIAGLVLHLLIGGLLIFTGVQKVLGTVPPEALVKLGLGGQARLIGAGATLSGLLLLIPRTSSLGLLLTSAFWGGAICIHLAHGESFLFQAVVLVLVWVGAALRNPATLSSFSGLPAMTRATS